ncbi:3-oxoacyl-[acyl-carrier-protein] synthase 1, partial [Haemophilus influenzae]
PLSIESGFFV